MKAQPFQVLRGAGLMARPTTSNDVALRIESVSTVLNRMVDGQSGILIDFRCKELVKGFEGVINIEDSKYQENDMKINLLKDRYSHIHDALQYLMLGAGEGRQVLGMNKPLETFNARVDYDVFNRDQNNKEDKVLWARM